VRRRKRLPEPVGRLVHGAPVEARGEGNPIGEEGLAPAHIAPAREGGGLAQEAEQQVLVVPGEADHLPGALPLDDSVEHAPGIGPPVHVVPD
jgi:hypothetical protein